MKRTIRTTTLCLLALAILAGSTASAGILDRLRGKDEEKRVAPRYDRYPSMSFQVGQLTRAGFDGWKVDEMDLVLTPDCVITDTEGNEVSLQEGTHVVIAGSRIGETLVALRVKLLPSGWQYGPENPEQKVERSEVDPTVGVGTGPL